MRGEEPFALSCRSRLVPRAPREYHHSAIEIHLSEVRPMKKLLSLSAALLLSLSSVAAFAASVTGTWTGDMKTPDGSTGFSLTFTFTQDGDRLTGSVASQQGDPLTIADGKVTGDKITFNVSFNGTTIHHEGTINGDEIKLTSKTDDGSFPGGEMTLKRSKPATP
jgi:hypothetical protein